MTFSSKLDWDALYEAHFRELVEIATSEFRIPLGEAQSLADEVFQVAMTVDSFERMDQHTWLVVSLRGGARCYNFRRRSARAIVR